VLGLWLVVVLLGVIVLGLVRRSSGVLAAVEARSESGETVRSTALGLTAAVYLLVSADCDACTEIVTQLEGIPDPLHGVRLVLVSDDSERDRRLLADVDAIRLYQRDGAIARAFQCTVTPYAFAIDVHGVVTASGVATHLTQLRGLARPPAGGNPGDSAALDR